MPTSSAELLIARLRKIVPAAEVLPCRISGSDIQIPLRLIVGAEWALEDLRQRLERPVAAAVGPTLLREWPPAKIGHQVWIVSVNEGRAGLLAEALSRLTVYPLALCSMTLGALRGIAPNAEIEAEIEAKVTTMRHYPRNIGPAYTVLVGERALDLIEAGLEQSRREAAKNPYHVLHQESLGGAIDEALGEAVRLARLHPLERGA